jgi:RecA/RadA recombinase
MSARKKEPVESSSSDETPKKPKVQGPKKAAPKTEAKPKGPTAKEMAEEFAYKMAHDPGYRGKVQVSLASDYSSPYYLRRPTGVLGLDLAMGGGFPAGGGVQIFGPGSAGKTYLAFRTAGQVQKNYGEDAIIGIGCSEIRLDKGFARRAGFCIPYSDREINDYNAIRISQGYPPFTPEEQADLRMQIGQVVMLAGANGAELLDSTIAHMRYFRSYSQLIILESLGALLTPDQDEKDVGDRTYGGSSGIITTWQNKNYPLYMLDGEDGESLKTTIIGINQVRAVLDGSPHGPKTRPAAGAWSWVHAQLVNLELKIGEPLWVDSQHTAKSGHVVKWDIRKGKAGTHDGIRGEYLWHHLPGRDPVFWSDVQNSFADYGIDTVRELVDTSRKMDVVLQGGAYLTFDDGIGPQVRVQGERGEPATEKLAVMVASDPELELRIRNACLKKANLTVQFR